MAKAKDKSALPWSIKGISKEARDMARQAAAEQGVTMGEWVSTAIRALQAHAEQPAVPAPVTPAESAQPAPPEMSLQVVQDRIAARVEESEQRLVSVLGPLNEVVQAMVKRLDDLERK
jgi:hypothetical protein